ATHAGGDEAHVRSLERLDDLVECLFGGGAPDLRPRTGAKPLRNLEAELDPAVGGRVVERLRVGVGDDEIDALDIGAHHVGDGVAARPADADHADPRAKLVNLGPDEIDAHGPKPSPKRQRVEPSGRIFESLRVACQAKKLTERTKLGKKWRERLTFGPFRPACRSPLIADGR